MTTVQRWKRDLSWEYRKLQGKGMFFRFWLAMLTLGIVEHLWEFYSGAGVAGYMMRRQIENNGSLGVGFWPAMAFLLFIIGPFVMLGITEPKRDPHRTGGRHVSGKVVLLSICSLLTAMSAGGYWMANRGPDTKATPISIDVGAVSGEFKDGMVRLRGVPQPLQGLSYVAVSSLGRGASRTTTAETQSFVPITAATWKPGEPVRFLLASDQEHLRIGVALPAGVMLADSLPWYLTSALERRGVRLTKPYHVVYTNTYLATRGNWDALTAIAGFFAFIAWGITAMMLWPDRKSGR